MSHASLFCLTIGMETTSLLTFRILRFRPRRLASLVAQFCMTTRKLLRPPIFFRSRPEPVRRLSLNIQSNFSITATVGETRGKWPL